ncbi:XRE family transcriptional regulator [Nocardiopsis sp. CT-R113]|uniref:XRE family transcriptional regulator n=1 Tax=Nocardiopsis codii TaxID=3065942 RepID=A0ABU7KBZ4_9ACTN|nr:helix-turn-helix domain-containing protein [Nocardiopsis sp. CT-R113]MEE2039736.1 XRE family transcriptional regulator [Nocardiopsis sp. CT-R113]
MSGHPASRITIPSWAWEREHTADFLRKRDVQALLQFARQYGGASQMAISAATGLSQGRVSEVLNGRKTVTAFEVYERIADGLGMPDRSRMQFGLAPRNPGTFTEPESAEHSAASSLPAPRSPGPGEDAKVRRRQFVGLAGTALFQATTGSVLDMDEIAAALTRYAGGGRATTAPATSLSELTKRTHAAKAGYQACHYTAVAKRLPELLRGLDDAVTGMEGDCLIQVHALRAEAYHVAASLLLKCEERGLSYLAADRSMRAAEDSESPAVVGASARAFTRALMRERHYKAATELATSTAERVDSAMDEPTPESLSVYGALLLSGAVSAAKRENRGQALSLLDEAGAAGERLGGDFNYQWTAFGPTNVLLHRVSAAVELGDAGSAIDYARQVRLDNIDIMERKVTLFIDAARAYQQWGKTEHAYQALRSAEDMASEELTARPVVHQLISDIRTRASGHLYGNVSELAERVGA